MTDRMRDWVVGTTLRQQARTRPDAVYAEMTTGGGITYGEIDVDADRIAVALDGLGIGVGDHVLVMMRNSLAFLQCWLGIMRRGAVIVPVNTAFRGDFLEFIVNDSGARLMVVDADLLPVV